MTGGNSSEAAAQLVDLLGDDLTPREQAVLARVLLGMRTEGIALDLHLKPASIVTFRKRAYAKLGITTQAELFARCLRLLPQRGSVPHETASGTPARRRRRL